MDEHKICFICCTNDGMYEKECRGYLERLDVPEGMQMEIKMVYGAASMASGYNQAMQESDAKYKVYLHQDMFLLNSNFIYDILKLFADKQVGMCGVVGGIGLPENGIIYSAWNCGRLKTNDSFMSFEIVGKIPQEDEGLVVEAVDGCLIATQYDILWREDLFTGWDFYDVSQAIEFRKAGYLVKIPAQKDSWCFHDDGYQNLEYYEIGRQIFIREYGSYLSGGNVEQNTGFQPEQWEVTQEVKGQLVQLFDRGEFETVYVFLYENYQKLSRETELSDLRNVMEIWYEEQVGESKSRFFLQGDLWEDVKHRYHRVRFWIYGLEFGMGDGGQKLAESILQNRISVEALVKLVSHSTLDTKQILRRLSALYRKAGGLQAAENLQKLSGGQDKQKVAFIFCCNNEQYLNECRSYLDELELPEGYGIEVLPVIGAKSMAAGYNQAMAQTDAKYKVYLHQDVFIWNRRFIFDILDIFENKQIGVIGVLGGVNIPDDGILYPAWNVGMSYACDTQDAGIKQGENPQQGTCRQVEAIDGMLMATQYDLPWREDLFAGWDFYDISQSFEFRKAGYSVVVPHQQTPWCMHDCGRSKLSDYNQGRRTILQEYSAFFQNPAYREGDFCYRYELKQQYQTLTDQIISCMEYGDLKNAVELCRQYDDAVIMDSDLSLLKKIVSVCEIEYELYGVCQSWAAGEQYGEAKKRYTGLKFKLWDLERDRDTEKVVFKHSMQQKQYSIPLAVVAGIHNMFHFERLICVLAEIVRLSKDVKGLDYLEAIAKQVPAGEPVLFEEIRKEIEGVPSVFKTEEEIRQIEKICACEAKIREEELPAFREHINHVLKKGDREEFTGLLSSKEFCAKFEGVTDMAYMMLVNQIYQEEMEAHVKYTVLDGKGSIDEIMSFIQDIKFGLWRLEFDAEDRAGSCLLELVHRQHISGCLLKYAVHVAGMDKVGLLTRLAALFLEHNMPGMAFSMLKYADELCPGTEEILCTMADLCLKAGKKEEAAYCLKRVGHPTQITEMFRKLCES